MLAQEGGNIIDFVVNNDPAVILKFSLHCINFPFVLQVEKTVAYLPITGLVVLRNFFDGEVLRHNAREV